MPVLSSYVYIVQKFIHSYGISKEVYLGKVLSYVKHIKHVRFPIPCLNSIRKRTSSIFLHYIKCYDRTIYERLRVEKDWAEETQEDTPLVAHYEEIGQKFRFFRQFFIENYFNNDITGLLDKFMAGLISFGGLNYLLKYSLYLERGIKSSILEYIKGGIPLTRAPNWIM